jgi:hypothetical protein
VEIVIPNEALAGPGSKRADEQFFGVPYSAKVIQHEKPWHRMAAYLFAAGRDRREVARAVEKSEEQVGLLMRQEWFQAQVTAMMAEDGKDICELFKSEAMNSLHTLVELRDDVETPKSVRLASALAILDRAPNVGKPVQRIETMRRPFSGDPVVEAERLKEENKQLLEKYS